MKKKQETLMEAAKDTVKLWIVSGMGIGMMGAMGGIVGPAAAPVTWVVGAGLALANVGRMGKTGMTVAKSIQPTKKKTLKTMDKWWWFFMSNDIAENIVKRIIGKKYDDDEEYEDDD